MDKEKPKKKNIKFFKFIYLLLFLSCILFCGAIYYLNVLPFKYFILVVTAAVFIIFLFALVLLNRRVKKFIKFFFSILAIIIMTGLFLVSKYSFNVKGVINDVTKKINYKTENYDVIVLDNSNYEDIKDLENMKNFEFVKGDITDREFIDKLFNDKKFDVVINFAAESHVDNSIKNPGIFLNTNIIGTQVLMDASRKYNIKRYHQVSTDEVYGDLPLDRPDLLFTEDTPIHTSSPYSSSKAGADLLVGAYHRTFGLPTTISRCSNNYGPYQFPEKLIPVVISKALKNEPIPVYGKGENVRDWIHVIDHNIGVDLIVRNGRVGEVYNLGGHSERTNLDVVKTILKQMGKSEDLITYVNDRPGHDLRYAIDSTKVEKELGWDRTYTFEKGIKETVDWYLNNQEWIDNILSGEYREAYKK